VNKAAVTLLMVMLVLLTIGVVMLFSVSAPQAKDRYGDARYLLKRQLVWLVLGGVGCATAAGMPYPKLRGMCVPALAVLVLLLLAVWVPHLGVKVSGARRWLGVGGLRFQPSEFAKLALIIWLAHWLTKEKRRINRFGRGFVVPMAVTGVVLVLIIAEPDFGSTALLGCVALSMMFIAGARLLYLVPTVLSAAVAFCLLIRHSPVRMQRFLAYLDLEKYKQGAGYQVWQAILAFGSGGLNGLGLGNSRQKMFYLPEAHTDFIFPILGEELGLIGTLTVLLLFAVLVVCGVIISLRSSDLFGRYLGFGVTLMIAFQALINIGVVTAWLPTKGLPLPFISFGGSNLMMNMMAVGVLLSIFRHSASEGPADEQEFFARRASMCTDTLCQGVPAVNVYPDSVGHEVEGAKV
jgi:cell division protein FtsW